MRCGCRGADSSDHASSCCSAVGPSLARGDLTSFMSYLQVVGCVIIADAWGGWMDAIMHRKVEGLHAHLPPGLHHIIFLPLQTKLLTILSPKSVMGLSYFPDETARNPQPRVRHGTSVAPQWHLYACRPELDSILQPISIMFPTDKQTCWS